MKKLFVITLLMLALSMLAAHPAYLLGIPAAQKTTDNPNALRTQVQNLAKSGLEIYYYNDHQIIAGSNSPDYPLAILLGSPENSRLYLVTKHSKYKDIDISEVAEVLLDLHTSVLIRTPMDEVQLRSRIMSPFVPLELVPIKLAGINEIQNILGETRTSIDQMIAQVSADSVLAFIQNLQNFQTRYALADNRLTVANWIKSQFQRVGVADASLHNFQWNGTTQYNVVATIPGTVYPDTYIIVGGHHDSVTYDNPMVFAPGADDNASGTVAALEMARVMMATGFQPKCSIRFVTFAAEEFGLWGAKAYAQMADQTDMDIRLMINHDMISNTSPNDDDPRVLLMPYDSFMQHTDHAAWITTQYTPLVPVYGSMNSGSSDSYPFWQRGFPAIYFFEYNFSQVYHSNNDIVANINPVYAAKVIRASVATAASYANMPSAPANLQAQDLGTGTGIMVTWSEVNDPNFAYYKIYWGTEPGVYTNYQYTSSTVYAIYGLTEGQTCYVAVSSVDNTDVESFMVTTSATPYLIPQTPANFVDAPVLNGINLSWTANTEFDMNVYKLYRSQDPEVLGDLIASLNPNVTTYSDTGLEGSLSYYCYRICAVDASQNQSPFTEVLMSRPVTLNMGVLIVDETKNYGGNGSVPFQPAEAAVDAFYTNVLQHVLIGGSIDLEETAMPLRLADIGIYSSILWHGNDFAEVTYPNMVKDALKQYIQLGGNVMFSVFHPSQAFELNAGYPATFGSSAFINEVLGISGVDYSTAARFNKAIGNHYPLLYGIDIDTDKIPAAFNGHLFHVEGFSINPSAQTLYTYGSNYESSTAQGSLNGSVVGVLNSFGEGKVITLSFPLYYMLLDDAHDMVLRAFAEIFGEMVSVDDEAIPAASSVVLTSAFPNPFAKVSSISYKTSDLRNPIKIQIYNLKGQLVKTIFDGVPEKNGALNWDGKDKSGKSVANGVYYIKASQNGAVSTQKIALLK